MVGAILFAPAIFIISGAGCICNCMGERSEEKGKAPGYTAAGPYTLGLFEMKNEFSR